jgi:hypothetical protein
MDDETARSHSSRVISDLAPAAISNLQVVIPHKAPQFTRAALKYAASLAIDLNVHVRLIDVHVVPYGVPLDEPTVSPRHLARRVRQLALESDVPVSAEVVYARDWEQGLRRSLAPGSLVLMAIKRSWWRTSEKRLAARLRKVGHQVIWVETVSGCERKPDAERKRDSAQPQEIGRSQ